MNMVLMQFVAEVQAWIEHREQWEGIGSTVLRIEQRLKLTPSE
jgi:hypothetical protein